MCCTENVRELMNLANWTLQVSVTLILIGSNYLKAVKQKNHSFIKNYNLLIKFARVVCIYEILVNF